MPSYTIYGDLSSGRLSSTATTYAGARDGNGTISGGAPNIGQVGQDRSGTTRYCFEAFYAFDTSSIDDGDTVTAVGLTLTVLADDSTTDFNVQVQGFNWGATMTSADWQDQSELAALTDWASSVSTSGLGATMAFTGNASFIAGISKTGVTYFILSSSRHEAGSAPADGVPEHVRFYDSTASGTSQDPVLDITTTGGFIPRAVILL